LRAFGLLLRFYSYLFHLASSGFFLGLALISMITGSSLNLDALGFTPNNATLGAFILGIVGLASTLLALFRVFRFLFPGWAAIVVWLMIKGFILSPATFINAQSFRWAVLLILGAVGAFFGALWTLKPKHRL
jgi:hypothetical protein